MCWVRRDVGCTEDDKEKERGRKKEKDKEKY
jgi:hypothetical protein